MTTTLSSSLPLLQHESIFLGLPQELFWLVLDFVPGLSLLRQRLAGHFFNTLVVNYFTIRKTRRYHHNTTISYQDQKQFQSILEKLHKLPPSIVVDLHIDNLNSNINYIPLLQYISSKPVHFISPEVVLDKKIHQMPNKKELLGTMVSMPSILLRFKMLDLDELFEDTAKTSLLKNVSIERCKMQDIAVLLPNVEKLCIHAPCTPTFFITIGACKHLTSLDLRRFDTSQTDLSALKQLPNLISLSLNDSQSVIHLSTFEDLVSLQSLTIRSCDNVEDLSFFKHPTLVKLVFEFSKLTDIKILGLPNLKTLCLGWCETLVAVTELPPSLQRIRLTCCKISNLVGLNQCPDLRKISIWDCPELCISTVTLPLLQLKKFKWCKCCIVSDDTDQSTTTIPATIVRHVSNLSIGFVTLDNSIRHYRAFEFPGNVVFNYIGRLTITFPLIFWKCETADDSFSVELQEDALCQFPQLLTLDVHYNWECFGFLYRDEQSLFEIKSHKHLDGFIPIRLHVGSIGITTIYCLSHNPKTKMPEWTFVSDDCHEVW